VLTDLHLVEKSTRKKRRASKFINHYYGLSRRGQNTVLKRGRYFVTLRRERKILRDLVNMTTPKFVFRERAIARRVYYRTLPFLFNHLRHPDDYYHLRYVENFLYNWINISRSEKPYLRKAKRLSHNITLLGIVMCDTSLQAQN